MSDRWLGRACWGLVACAWLVLGLAWIPNPGFSPDSWAYHELANSLWVDPYRFTHWRAYAFEIPYSASFPPLWPAILALVGAATAAGPGVGVVVAWLAFGGFLLLGELVGRRAFGLPWIGAAAALTLGADTWFLTEIEGAGAIPLHLFFMALAALLLLRPSAGVGLHVLYAAVLGLAILNRFDALPFAAGMGLLALLRWRNPVGLLCAAITGLLVLSPWIWHSVTRFGVLFVTDNSVVALSLDRRAFVTDWWPTPQPSLSDDPWDWLAKVVSRLRRLAGAQFWGVMFGPWWLTAGALGLALVAWRARPGGAPPGLPAQAPWLLAIMAAILLPTLTNLATGYWDMRYFAPSRWWGALLVIGAAVWLSRGWPWGRLVAPALVLLATAAVLWKAGPAAAGHLAERRLTPPAAFTAPPGDAEILACLRGVPAPAVLVANPYTASRLGALHGLTTLMQPRTWDMLSPADRALFIRRFAVTDALLRDARPGDVIAEGFVLRAREGCDAPLLSIEAQP